MPADAYLNHLKKTGDLVTTYEETRAGFVSIALERNRRATPFVDEARALQVKAQTAKTAKELMKMADIRRGLIAAAGLSDKAASHLDPKGIEEAIEGLIETFLEPAGPKFVEELVFRYLLTRGDALGGAMRNIVGFFALKKLTAALLAALNIAGIEFFYLGPENDKWLRRNPEASNDIESSKGLAWEHDGRKRTLLYNIKVPQIGNNIDLCLFDCEYQLFGEEVLSMNSSFVALGELKGGIDPAGADEHWKTAQSALRRIRDNFWDQIQSVSVFRRRRY